MQERKTPDTFLKGYFLLLNTGRFIVIGTETIWGQSGWRIETNKEKEEKTLRFVFLEDAIEYLNKNYSKEQIDPMYLEDDDGQDKMVITDTSLICENGHAINPSVMNFPFIKDKSCFRCGARVLDKCQNCGTKFISITFSNEGIYIGVPVWGFEYRKYLYCPECGNAFPWTEEYLKAHIGLLVEKGQKVTVRPLGGTSVNIELSEKGTFDAIVICDYGDGIAKVRELKTGKSVILRKIWCEIELMEKD